MAGSATPDGVRLEIRENSNMAGNPVKLSTGLPAVASSHYFVDANSQVGTGPFPFPVQVSGLPSTISATLDLTGASTASATGPMTNTIVAAAQTTTFTSAGFIRVAITDSAGNLTSGFYYINVGTLS